MLIQKVFLCKNTRPSHFNYTCVECDQRDRQKEKKKRERCKKEYLC